MDSVGFAITSILSVALCIGLIRVGANPKQSRLFWLDLWGMLDTDTTREDRRWQEGQLRFLAFTLVFLLAASGVSSAFWSYEQLRESRRTKNTVERELEYLRRQAEGARTSN